MKKRILVLFVAALVVFGFPLYAGGKKEVKTKETAAVPGEPQYGGTLTWFTECQGWIPGSWDIASMDWKVSANAAPRLQSLLTGDFEKYGPRGTNDYPFQANNTPADYVGGLLAESWEVLPGKIVFHIRQGVMWADSPIMESRELTADDVVFSLKRLLAAFDVRYAGRMWYVDDVFAEDRYTVVVKTNGFDAGWMVHIGLGRFTQIQPPEVFETGAPDDWRSHIGVGTGPFVLANYTEGSSATYVKNPNYWDTTTIDGVEYETPFVDKLIYPFMVDQTTQIAALRTGKIDWMQEINLRYEDTLRSTSPDLILMKMEEGNVLNLTLRTDQEPFDDVNVRRALMFATNKEVIGKAVYGEAVRHAFPIGPGAGPAYTPFEELPELAQDLYGYDPERAKQLLVDAGLPDGFDMNINFRSQMIITQDFTAMLAEQWAKIGVRVKLTGLEEGAYKALAYYPGDFLNASTGGASQNQNALLGIEQVVTDANTSRWRDEYALNQYMAAVSEEDSDKRTAMIKELAVYIFEQVPKIPIGGSIIVAGYWPWLKNYYGETAIGELYNHNEIQASVWIDQDLKKSMGY